MGIDREKVERAVRLFLEAVGQLGRETEETPRRVAEALCRVLPGLQGEAPELGEAVAGPEGPVLVREIPFYSMCEHHLLPFFGTAEVAYLPSDRRIAGVGAIAEIVTWRAGRLQLQERLTEEIAGTIEAWLHPKALRVRLKARHLCLEMRDRSMRGALMVTEATRGEAAALPPLDGSGWGG